MKKGSLSTVFLVVLVDLMGFGIILPLMPFFASSFHASPLQVGLLYSVYSLAQLIFSPIWGSWSDRIGRRPIMLLSTLGAAIAYVVFGLAESLSVLFLSRLFAGIMGGNISTALAYITDVTPAEKRAQGMGLIGAAFGIGFVLGPAIATGIIHPSVPSLMESWGLIKVAEILRHNTYEMPAFFAGLLSFISFLLVVFKLPESLTAEERGHVQKRMSVLNPDLWKSFTKEGKTGIKGLFALMLLAMFILSFGHAGLYSSFPLFCESVMNMSADQVGIQFSVLGLIAVVIQGGLIRPLSKRFAEEHIFIVGNVLMFLGMLVMGFSSTITVLTSGLALMAIGNSLNSPTINSLISKEADQSMMGTTMGISQSIAGLGRVVGPTWGGFLFGVQAYLPFWATSFVLFILVLMGLRLWHVRVGVPVEKV
ncbi:MFS transporter [bacterium]|nr:MAG: MFS transporter [bacterium]